MEEERWTLSDVDLCNASGYTLKSLPEGRLIFYANVYDAITTGTELLATIPQVRQQIAIIEESHRQNQ